MRPEFPSSQVHCDLINVRERKSKFTKNRRAPSVTFPRITGAVHITSSTEPTSAFPSRIVCEETVSAHSFSGICGGSVDNFFSDFTRIKKVPTARARTEEASILETVSTIQEQLPSAKAHPLFCHQTHRLPIPRMLSRQ